MSGQQLKDTPCRASFHQLYGGRESLRIEGTLFPSILIFSSGWSALIREAIRSSSERDALQYSNDFAPLVEHGRRSSGGGR